MNQRLLLGRYVRLSIVCSLAALLSTQLCLGGGEENRPIGELLTCTGATITPKNQYCVQDLTPQAPTGGAPFSRCILPGGPVGALVATTGKGLTLASIIESQTGATLDQNGKIGAYVARALADKQDMVQKIAYGKSRLSVRIQNTEKEVKSQVPFSKDTATRLRAPNATDCLSMLLLHRTEKNCSAWHKGSVCSHASSLIYASKPELTPVISPLLQLQRESDPTHAPFTHNDNGLLETTNGAKRPIFCKTLLTGNVVFAGNEAFWKTVVNVPNNDDVILTSPNEHVIALCKILRNEHARRSHAREDGNVARKIIAALLRTPKPHPICFLVMQRHDPSHQKQVSPAPALTLVPAAPVDTADETSDDETDAPGTAPHPRRTHHQVTIGDGNEDETPTKRRRTEQPANPSPAAIQSMPVTPAFAADPAEEPAFPQEHSPTDTTAANRLLQLLYGKMQRGQSSQIDANQ